MDGFGKYPENRLDIRLDKNGNITLEENREFAKYYAPTREELEERLEELQDELDLLNIDEPADMLSLEYEEWEDRIHDLEEQIREIEESIENLE